MFRFRRLFDVKSIKKEQCLFQDILSNISNIKIQGCHWKIFPNPELSSEEYPNSSNSFLKWLISVLNKYGYFRAEE